MEDNFSNLRHCKYIEMHDSLAHSQSVGIFIIYICILAEYYTDDSIRCDS